MIGRGGGEGGGGRNSKERNEKDSVSVSGENQDSSQFNVSWKKGKEIKRQELISFEY